MTRTSKSIARTQALSRSSSFSNNSNYWIVMLMTVILLYGAGELPSNLALVRWLMCIVGSFGVLLAFRQAASAAKPPHNFDI